MTTIWQRILQRWRYIFVVISLLYISLLYRCYIAALTTNYFNKNFPQEDGVFQNKKNHKRAAAQRRTALRCYIKDFALFLKNEETLLFFFFFKKTNNVVRCVSWKEEPWLYSFWRTAQNHSSRSNTICCACLFQEGQKNTTGSSCSRRARTALLEEEPAICLQKIRLVTKVFLVRLR